MRIFVLTRTNIFGGSVILGLFSELDWAKKAAEKKVQSFTWEENTESDRITYVSKYAGHRPIFAIESYEINRDILTE